MVMSYDELAALFDGEGAGDASVQADYVRLFVVAEHAGTAPLYASWYLDGQLLGPSRDWVENEYRTEGIVLADDAEQPADYLPCELEYLYFLSRHEGAAATTGDDRALAGARSAQRRFLEQHVLRWLPSFLRQARLARPGTFYAAALDRLERFVSEEHARLLSTCHDIAYATPPDA